MRCFRARFFGRRAQEVGRSRIGAERVGKLGQLGELFPVAARLGGQPGLLIDVALGNPLPQLRGIDRSVGASIGADDPVFQFFCGWRDRPRSAQGQDLLARGLLRFGLGLPRLLVAHFDLAKEQDVPMPQLCAGHAFAVDERPVGGDQVADLVVGTDTNQDGVMKGNRNVVKTDDIVVVASDVDAILRQFENTTRQCSRDKMKLADGTRRGVDHFRHPIPRGSVARTSRICKPRAARPAGISVAPANFQTNVTISGRSGTIGPVR